MYKSDFKNGGFVEIEDDKDLACVVIGKEGSDVLLHGGKDEILQGIALLTVRALLNSESAARFAFITKLREMIVEENLLGDDFEWKLYLKGTEVPVKLEDAAAMLLERIFKNFMEDIKKDR